MSLTDREAAALARAFHASGWATLDYAAGEDRLVLRRGAATDAPAAPAAAPAPQPALLRAPRLGQLHPVVAEGDSFAAGALLAEIAVLDRRHPVTAEAPGRLARWQADPGALVEWGAPIAILDPA